MVERREDGAYLGQVGFADFKRDMTPSIEGIPEMGWIMAPQAQGQGYATEAVLAALAWADETLGRREIVAIISHGNIASIRVAEKGGFGSREEAVYKSEPILLFRRPARWSHPGESRGLGSIGPRRVSPGPGFRRDDGQCGVRFRTPSVRPRSDPVIPRSRKQG